MSFSTRKHSTSWVAEKSIGCLAFAWPGSGADEGIVTVIDSGSCTNLKRLSVGAAQLSATILRIYEEMSSPGQISRLAIRGFGAKAKRAQIVQARLPGCLHTKLPRAVTDKTCD